MGHKYELVLLVRKWKTKEDPKSYFESVRESGVNCTSFVFFSARIKNKKKKKSNWK